MDQRGILRDGDLLDRTLDTYVAAQLPAECSLGIIGADLFHLRDADGRTHPGRRLSPRMVRRTPRPPSAPESSSTGPRIVRLTDRLTDRIAAVPSPPLPLPGRAS